MIDAFFGRKQLERALPCIAIAGFIVAALNWPQERVRVRFWELAGLPGAGQSFEMTAGSEIESVGRFAGWPVSIPLEAGVPTQPGTLLAVVAVNLLVAALLCLAAGSIAIALSSIKSRVTTQSAAQRGSIWRRVGARAIVASMAVAVLCLGAGGYLVEQRFSSEWRLGDELDRYGKVGRAVQLPAFVIQRLPARLIKPFARIESISLHGAPEELVRRALQRPGLQSVSLHNQTMSASLWSDLAAISSLDSLSLIQCRWPAEAATGDPARAELQGMALRSLTMRGCSGNMAILSSLHRFPNLESLVIVDSSPVNGPAIEDSLPKQLKRLCLTIDAKVTSAIKLASYDRLESLEIRAAKNMLPDTALSIELDHLSQLTRVVVGNSFLVDLKLVDVPRLRMLETDAVRQSHFADVELPRLLSVRSLSIDHAAGMQELQISADGLQQIAITGTPNLRLLKIVPARPATEVSINLLIANVAQCDGPTTLDLSGLPLAAADLTPLAQNRRINTLILEKTGVRADQLTTIEHGNRIRSLNLEGCEINQHDLTSIFASYEGIKELFVDTNRFETLEIIDQPQLTHLFTTPTRSARTVKIVGCPKLTGTLTLGHRVQQLEIRDAQSLTGLSVKGWVPRNAVLEGFRDLENVELPGRNVNEQHFKSLLSCPLLCELRLLAPSIPAASLKQVAKLPELAVLKLPGTQVTDQTVASWGSLEYLRDVDLSHTQVTIDAVRTLSDCANLQYLHLGHTKVQPDDLDLLTDLKSLVEIDLAGVGITPEHLQQCLVERFVDRVNLSGTTISPELLDVLASRQARRLLFIGLRDCRLTDDDVMRIANAHPQLAMDIDGNLISSKVIRELNSQGRLISCSDRAGFEAWLHALNSGQPRTIEASKLVQQSTNAPSNGSWAAWRFRSINRNDRNPIRVPLWFRRGIENGIVQ